MNAARGSYDRSDRAHEHDMAMLRAEQLREDCGCDQGDLDELAESDEQAERNAEGTYDHDEPTEWELDAYYEQQDDQVRAYNN